MSKAGAIALGVLIFTATSATAGQTPVAKPIDDFGKNPIWSKQFGGQTLRTLARKSYRIVRSSDIWARIGKTDPIHYKPISSKVARRHLWESITTSLKSAALNPKSTKDLCELSLVLRRGTPSRERNRSVAGNINHKRRYIVLGWGRHPFLFNGQCGLGRSEGVYGGENAKPTTCTVPKPRPETTCAKPAPKVKKTGARTSRERTHALNGVSGNGFGYQRLRNGDKVSAGGWLVKRPPPPSGISVAAWYRD